LVDLSRFWIDVVYHSSTAFADPMACWAIGFFSRAFRQRSPDVSWLRVPRVEVLGMAEEKKILKCLLT
jgi:hypothetical protein